MKDAMSLIRRKYLILKIKERQLTKHDEWTFSKKLHRLVAWSIKIEYEFVMIKSCVVERRKERNKSKNQVCLI